jgi:hypothetical protein
MGGMTHETATFVPRFTRKIYETIPHVNSVLLLLPAPAPSACSNLHTCEICLNAINSSRSGIVFEITIHTTFDEYKHAFESGLVPMAVLQPPQYPDIRIRWRFGSSFDLRYHEVSDSGA